MEGGRRAWAGEGEEEVRERRAVREREAERRVWSRFRRVIVVGWDEDEEGEGGGGGEEVEKVVVVVSSSLGVLNKAEGEAGEGKEEEVGHLRLPRTCVCCKDKGRSCRCCWKAAVACLVLEEEGLALVAALPVSASSTTTAGNCNSTEDSKLPPPRLAGCWALCVAATMAACVYEE